MLRRRKLSIHRAVCARASADIKRERARTRSPPKVNYPKPFRLLHCDPTSALFTTAAPRAFIVLRVVRSSTSLRSRSVSSIVVGICVFRCRFFRRVLFSKLDSFRFHFIRRRGVLFCFLLERRANRFGSVFCTSFTFRAHLDHTRLRSRYPWASQAEGTFSRSTSIV